MTGKEREVECLVDTGFGGVLVLSQLLFNKLGFARHSQEDGSRRVVNERTTDALAAAQIEWVGEIELIMIVVKDDLPIGS